MASKPNLELKQRYDRIFRRNPMAANVFLLTAELANDKGRVKITEEELTALFNARFNDPREYAL
ncbi:MAG: hypothetical protein M0P57_15025 [Syntrophales bacterium]|jgi:hypothetical protein|nr:hypothetical protein [Syntrophales bacterium]MDY0044420.1 hypothetical protein [Syntrophales bacterium]